MTLYRPAIVSILYLLNFVVGFSVIVGVILAYVWRGEEDTVEWEASHYTYLIRTFWIGFAVFVVAMIGYIGFFISIIAMDQSGPPQAPLFAFVFGFFAVFILSAIWFTTRCVMSLVKTGKQEPMPRPQTWLF